MSFSINFTARTRYEAQAKLSACHAPAAVKALIEKALDAMPAPRPQNLAAAGGASMQAGETRDVRVGGAGVSRQAGATEPEIFGVVVECWGHIAEAGDSCRSNIERFIVWPLAA
jgi:hypothetical protein